MSKKKVKKVKMRLVAKGKYPKSIEVDGVRYGLNDVVKLPERYLNFDYFILEDEAIPEIPKPNVVGVEEEAIGSEALVGFPIPTEKEDN